MTEIIRKPIRSYPLPKNLKELDEPWSEVEKLRHARVNVFQEGYSEEDGDNPLIVKPPRSKSRLLSKL